MKFLKIAILVVLPFLSSCSDDSNELSAEELLMKVRELDKINAIKGTWQPTKHFIQNVESILEGETKEFSHYISDSNSLISVCPNKPSYKIIMHNSLVGFDKDSLYLSRNITTSNFEYNNDFSNELKQDCDTSGKKEVDIEKFQDGGNNAIQRMVEHDNSVFISVKDEYDEYYYYQVEFLTTNSFKLKRSNFNSSELAENIIDLEYNENILLANKKSDSVNLEDFKN